MIQDILFSEMKAAASKVRLIGQLLSLKRCFGSHAKIGIVTAPGKVDECGTVAELVLRGHIPSGLEWIDQYITSIPTAYESPTDNFVVVPRRYLDGPPCPWDVAKQEQEIARARRNLARKRVITATGKQRRM